MLFTLLAMTAYALQNLSAREYGHKFPSGIVSQAYMIAFSMLAECALMAALGGAKLLSGTGWLLAAAYGVSFTGAMSTMTLAMGCGELGITVLIINSSLVVSVILGFTIWGDPISAYKLIGIALILVLLVLSSKSDNETKSEAGKREKLKWLLLTFACFFGNSLCAFLQTLETRANPDISTAVFSFWASVAALLSSVLILLVFRAKGDRSHILSIAPKIFLLLCVGIGAGTAGGDGLTLEALKRLDSSIVYPVRMGSLVLLMWLIGVVFYKEKVTRRGIVMLACGLAGIVLLNL